MANLFSALASAGSALSVLQQAMSTSSNNVTNASVAGYAAQRIILESRNFDLPGGQTGGISAGAVESSRDRYAELSVQYEAAGGGYADARASALRSIENPNGSVQRAAVMNSAQKTAEAFRSTAAGVRQQQVSADQQIQATVQKINSLAATIRDYNIQKRRHPQADAGLDARLHQALEDISGVAEVTPLFEADGTVTVLAGGQIPLVMGDQAFPLTAETSASGLKVIRGSDGTDITKLLTGGKLGGLLEVRNGTLARLLGGGETTGELDRLAAAFADRVNGLLQGGLTSADAGAAGVALFTYDQRGAAASLAVNPEITAAKLAAASAGPPVRANGVAQALAAMADGAAAEDTIDGESFLDFYSALASGVGMAAASATDASDRQKQVLAHARELRSAVSGVSLDQEAMKMLEFQRAYQASAKMIMVVDELTQTILGMIR
ncbi:MAG: flagellar hook-associated protein FlgK [Acidobacteria bacterium]|nr:flagellar hook-associated protein FlgK [Acidobacteriota bacterium]